MTENQGRLPAKPAAALRAQLKGILRLKTSELRQPLNTTAQPPIAAIVAPESIPQRPAQFAIEAPDAHEVYLAGTFNQWDPRRTPLKKRRDGGWHLAIRLSPGRYQYRFVVDGVWTTDPKALETVPNPFGSENSIVVIGS